MCTHDWELDCCHSILANRVYYLGQIPWRRYKPLRAYGPANIWVLIYKHHCFQPGSLDVRFKLLGSFLSTWTDKKGSSRRHTQLSAQHNQHHSVPVKRGSTCNPLDISRERRTKGCNQHRLRWIIVTSYLLHRFAMGHLQASKNCWVF